MCSAAPTTDISSNETTTVICAQRALDEVFPNVSKPINNNQVYFGSVDGTTRTYPGTDEYPCKDFDPRVRPSRPSLVSSVVVREKGSHGRH